MSSRVLNVLTLALSHLMLFTTASITTIPIANAASSSATEKATATISASCALSVQNLSFGNLVLPLASQSASTSMSVLCNNKASYTIGLAYGGIYGQSGVTGNYFTSGNFPSGNHCQTNTNFSGGDFGSYAGATACEFNEYNASGSLIGSYMVSATIANASSTPSTITNGKTYEFVTNTTDSSPPNTTLSNGKYIQGISYSYGKMIGVMSGDNIAYSIQVPNNPGQVWNAGNSSYSSTGTGATQSIPVVGTIIPAQSGGNYPTPDTYMDTVTTLINF
jgi:spore coat protein U-like protein